MNLRISPNFALIEFTKGRVTPTVEQYGNIVTAAKWLERLRERVGPIIISSGIRSAERNAGVGGADRSYHLYWGPGIWAVDIVSPTLHPLRLADACVEVGGFDSVISERADRPWPAQKANDGMPWVHVQGSPTPRGLTFTAVPKDKTLWGNVDKETRPEQVYSPGLRFEL